MGFTLDNGSVWPDALTSIEGFLPDFPSFLSLCFNIEAQQFLGIFD